ncbi:ABC-F family ATP-binding cassette domain-containing protein, partial [Candidatus Dojkabacteria bacterium]|nr:ABC-F family ATP-binding cassette domain-containing protein [Candidatus Dojkabacteria bacterium]
INSSYALLQKFLFNKDIQKYKIKELSPGQRARLSFAIFAQHNYEFLILDEPTNHLDIKTKEIIENALREYQGAILLVSHDRYFVNSVGMDRVITLEEGKITVK